MYRPLISIVVPVCNAEKYLHQCVKSLLRQEVREVEIILADDGSTDNSSRICEEYAQKDGRVRVIHQKNRGVSAARNAGMDIASGDYLGFADADDWVEPEGFLHMLRQIQSTGADVCYAASRFDGSIKRRYYSGNKELLLASEAMMELAAGNFISSADTAVYKRICIEGVRFREDIHYWEDLDFQFRVLQKAGRVCMVKEPYYHVRIHKESATHKKTSAKNASCLKIAGRLEAMEVPKRCLWIADTVRYKMLADLIVSIAERGLRKEDRADVYAQIKREAVLCLKKIGKTRYVTRNGALAIKAAGISPFIACFGLRVLLSGKKAGLLIKEKLQGMIWHDNH